MEFRMVRAKRELSREEALALFASASSAVLSTVDPDGEPYGVPISFALKGDRIYLHGSLKGGHRLTNLGAGCRACITVVTQDDVQPAEFTTRYASAMAFGRLRSAVDDDEKRAGLMALLRKYSSGHMEAGIRYIAAALPKTSVTVLEVERVSGKSNIRG